MRKRVGYIWLLLILCLSFLIGCQNSENQSSNDSSNKQETFVLSLNKTAMALLVGEEEVLTTNYNGTEEVVWLVDNETICSVSDGLVKGLSAGQTTVSAMVAGQTAKCEVKVNAVDKALLSFELGNQNIELEVGETYNVQYQIKYDGVSVEDADVQFALLDEADEKITLSTSGAITAKNAGTSTCIATVRYQGIEKDFSFTITVKSSAKIEIEETAISIYATDTFNGKAYKNTQTLKVKVYEGAEEVQNPELIWSVDDSEICEVVENTVTGKHIGKAFVTVSYTARDKSVVTDSVVVTVLTIEHSIDVERVEIEKAQGYVVDKAALLGDAEVSFERAFVVMDDFKSDVTIEENTVIFDEVHFSGNSVLYLETGVVTYGLNICLWNKTLTTAEDVKELLNTTSGWYKLGGDIDLSNTEWKYESSTIVFAGYFDGRGYTLKGLSGLNGLFRELGNGAIVRNVHFTGAVIGENCEVVGTVADETTMGANVIIENITVDVCNNGISTGGLIGRVGAGSNVQLKDVTVHSYTSGGRVDNGSLFGAFGGTATFENVKAYANTKPCGENKTSGNSGYKTINENANITIAPQKYAEEVLLIAEEIDFKNTVSNVKKVTLYTGTSREVDFADNKIKLNENELLALAGGTVEVLFELNNATVEYYVISVSSVLKISQSNAADLFKVSNCDIILTENIDLSKVAGTPIEFRGTFDGQGYTISGIKSRAKKIEYADGSISYWYSGIWSTINGGAIKNVAFIIDEISWCMGGIAYTAKSATLENVYVQVVSIASTGVEDNYQGALFRQVSLLDISLKDIVVEICEYTGTRIGYIGMCHNGPLKLEDKNCHFIGGNGNMVAYSENLAAGYHQNDNPISGANKYTDRAAFDEVRGQLSLSNEMLVWLGSSTVKPDNANRQESEEVFNNDWLNN